MNETKLIQVQDLSFTYPRSKKPVLHSLNFSVSQGEIFGLLGPSGSGKSSTQKILMGLLHNYSGSVSLFGKNPSLKANQLQSDFGVGFEFPSLFLRLSGRENLEYFASLYPLWAKSRKELKAWINYLLEDFDLLDAADTLVGTWSKGMKMRLNFLRAFVHKPKLVFLDEPSSGLDPNLSALIIQKIQNFRNDGGTVFLTTHQMELADALCDRVGFLIKGELRTIENPYKLKVQYGNPQVRLGLRQQDGSSQFHEYPLANLSQNQAFLSDLACKGFESIHSQEASLGDIFIKLCGTSLLENEDAQ